MAAGVAVGPLDLTERRSGIAAVLAIAAAVAALHLVTNGRYGFHRDELQVLSDARHLTWGFVAVPPFTPTIERLGLAIFGASVAGLRIFSVAAQFLVVTLAGLMARELGGGRLAQAAAALSVALSPLPIFEGTEFQYSSFDLLWWVLIAYFAIHLLKGENGRWWLAIGAATGLALQTKYSVCFYIAGILAGVALTPARRWFRSGWFWAGTAPALLIFLPNLIWQAEHHFVSVAFLQHIHKRDVGEGRAADFWKYQFLHNANLFAAPLWLAGMAAYLRSPRYRMLAWMYLAPLAIFATSRGRSYYMAPAYPMLTAMGAVVCANWTGRLRPAWRWSFWGVLLAGVAVYGLLAIAALVPLAQSGPLRAFALRASSDLRDEIGWHSLAGEVAAVRNGLSPEERASYGVLVWNYGEEGALETFGPALGLPQPISTTNSAWYWSYPKTPPRTLIVLGGDRAFADSLFTTCRLADHNGNAEDVKNEESADHPDIFVCSGLRMAWPEFWKKYRSFG